jgi:hypothetical protein
MVETAPFSQGDLPGGKAARPGRAFGQGAVPAEGAGVNRRPVRRSRPAAGATLADPPESVRQILVSVEGSGEALRNPIYRPVNGAPARSLLYDHSGIRL